MPAGLGFLPETNPPAWTSTVGGPSAETITINGSGFGSDGAARRRGSQVGAGGVQLGNAESRTLSSLQFGSFEGFTKKAA
jgi:hypothetical protein